MNSKYLAMRARQRKADEEFDLLRPQLLAIPLAFYGATFVIACPLFLASSILFAGVANPAMTAEAGEYVVTVGTSEGVRSTQVTAVTYFASRSLLIWCFSSGFSLVTTLAIGWANKRFRNRR